jgi:hypothetical protein
VKRQSCGARMQQASDNNGASQQQRSLSSSPSGASCCAASSHPSGMGPGLRLRLSLPRVSPCATEGAQFRVPEWATDVPEVGAALQVVKRGCTIGTLRLDRHVYYLLGRCATAPCARGLAYTLDHPTVSRLHAALVHGQGGVLYVVDLGSSHGTFLGGVRLESYCPVLLENGKMVSFGLSSRRYVVRLFPSRERLLTRGAGGVGGGDYFARCKRGLSNNALPFPAYAAPQQGETDIVLCERSRHVGGGGKYSMEEDVDDDDEEGGGRGEDESSGSLLTRVHTHLNCVPSCLDDFEGLAEMVLSSAAASSSTTQVASGGSAVGGNSGHGRGGGKNGGGGGGGDWVPSDDFGHAPYGRVAGRASRAKTRGASMDSTETAKGGGGLHGGSGVSAAASALSTAGVFKKRRVSFAESQPEVIPTMRYHHHHQQSPHGGGGGGGGHIDFVTAAATHSVEQVQSSGAIVVKRSLEPVPEYERAAAGADASSSPRPSVCPVDVSAGAGGGCAGGGGLPAGIPRVSSADSTCMSDVVPHIANGSDTESGSDSDDDHCDEQCQQRRQQQQHHRHHHHKHGKDQLHSLQQGRRSRMQCPPPPPPLGPGLGATLLLGGRSCGGSGTPSPATAAATCRMGMLRQQMTQLPPSVHASIHDMLHGDTHHRRLVIDATTTCEDVSGGNGGSGNGRVGLV